MKGEHINKLMLELYTSGYKYLSKDVFVQIREHLPICPICRKRFKEALKETASWEAVEKDREAVVRGLEMDAKRGRTERAAVEDKLHGQKKVIPLQAETLRSRARKCLWKESCSALTEKLNGDKNGYVQRDLWVGELAGNSEYGPLKPGYRDSDSEHQLAWRRFNIERLAEVSGDSFVICGECGMGKTTFMRYAQNRILKNHSLWSRYWKGFSISADLMRVTSIASFIALGPERGKPSLVFEHQGLQEFLAAKWAVGSDERIKHVLDESLELKWKEVIKFMAGALGETIIERLHHLGGKDDIHYSRLFLTAECYREVDPSVQLGPQLVSKLADALSIEPDAATAISRSNTREAVDALMKLLRSYAMRCFDTFYGRARLAEALSDIAGIFLPVYLDDIVRLLGTKDDLIYDKAIELLSQWTSHLTLEHMTEVIWTACRRGDSQKVLFSPQNSGTDFTVSQGSVGPL